MSVYKYLMNILDRFPLTDLLNVFIFLITKLFGLKLVLHYICQFFIFFLVFLIISKYYAGNYKYSVFDNIGT